MQERAFEIEAGVTIADALRARFHASDHAVFAFDAEGRRIYSSPAFDRLVGYDGALLVGRLPPYPYWIEGDRDQLLDRLEAVLSGRMDELGVQALLMRFRHSAGHVVQVVLTGGRLLQGGRYEGRIGFAVEVSDLERDLSEPQSPTLLTEHLARAVARMRRGIESLKPDPPLPADRIREIALGHGLTAREEEVLRTFRETASLAQTSRLLHLSMHTLRNHMKAIYRKLGVRSQAELFRRFL